MPRLPMLRSVLPLMAVLATAAYTAGISADCIPNVPASLLRWTASNTQLASIDSMTGKLTARGVGNVSVMVHAPGTDAGLGSAQVNVIVR